MVVVDIRMPGLDGIEATRQVVAGPEPPRVLVLTTFDEDEDEYAALRAGASGFLVKDMALEDILAAGDALIAPGVTRRLIADFVSRPDPAPPRRPTDGITDREGEVLTLVGKGRSNSEIAAELPATACTSSSSPTRWAS